MIGTKSNEKSFYDLKISITVIIIKIKTLNFVTFKCKKKRKPLLPRILLVGVFTPNYTETHVHKSDTYGTLSEGKTAHGRTLARDTDVWFALTCRHTGHEPFYVH